MMKEDWVEVELGEVCKYSKGKKPKTLKKEFSEEVPFPYINIKAFEKGIFDEYTDGIKCNLCEDGDLLMVWDGARAGFTGKAKKGVIGSTLMKIEPKVGIEKNYLFYFLLSLYRKLNTNPRGVGIPHVEPRLLWLSNLILPPLPIQRAIVSKIETLFSDLDKGIADLKKAQEQLKIYRQAVLKKAFEGELTREWREQQTDLPTAEELLEQIKEERQKYYEQQLEEWKQAVKEWEENGKEGKKPGKPTRLKNEFVINESEEIKLPYSWQYVSIDFATYKLGDGLHGTPSYSDEGEYYFINGNNLNGKKILIKPNTKRVDKAEYLKYRKELNKDTILVSINGTIGNTSFFNNEKVILGKSACYFNLLSTLDKNYVRWRIDTLGFKNYAYKKATGSTIKNVPLKAMREYLFPLCSLQEQHQIVREIESRLSVCEKVEQNITEALETSEALRQSILKKAFEGKLLSPAEIDACRREADYEPADVLLERIRKERPSGK